MSLCNPPGLPPAMVSAPAKNPPEMSSGLFPSGSEAFAAMREEAAISRLYGGIHYRSDIEGGKQHGARPVVHRPVRPAGSSELTAGHTPQRVTARV
jgi:hypothetical protein